MLTSELTSQSTPQMRSKIAALNTFLNPEPPPNKTRSQAATAVPQSSPRSLLQKSTLPDNPGKLEFKEPGGARTLLKGPLISQIDSFARTRQNFLTSRTSASRDPRSFLSHLQCLRAPQETYRSHEKIPQKMRAARDIYREAVLKPIKVDQSHLSEKVKIMHNLYNKQDRYFYCNRIDIRSIVRGIYYHGQTVDSLDEFKMPAFKSFVMQKEYFDTVLEEAKAFVEAVTRTIKSKIVRLVNPKDEHCRPSEANLTYIHFLRAPSKYRQVIDHLFNIFKHLEHVNLEIEKLNAYFIEFCREKNRLVDDFKFHAQFIATIYQDRSIGGFVDQQLKTFNKLHIYETKYPDVVEKVYEIHDICKKRIDEILAAKAQTAARERMASAIEIGNNRTIALSVQTWTDVPEDRQGIQYYGNRSHRVRETTESCSKAFQSQADDNSQALEAKSEAIGKKKKKRKNKKKTGTEASVQAQNEPAADVACHEELPQDTFELKEFVDRLAAVDSRYCVDPSKRLRIEFSAEELAGLRALARVGGRKSD